MTKSELAGQSIMICLDANSKLGPHHIPGDHHDQSENGKLVERIRERHALTVANGIQGKSHGVITRERTTVDDTEKSVIDFVLITEGLVECLKSIVIDEKKSFSLECLTKTKKSTIVKQSYLN